MDYDAASIVGKLAGLSEPDRQTPKPVEPSQLVAAFCRDDAAGLVSKPGTEEANGIKTSRGWCGFRGGDGDSLKVGFDDGYDLMGYLGDRGWRALPAKGDWPYVVYMARVTGEVYAIAEYCEADLTVWEFPSEASLRAFYSTLKDAP